MAVTKKSKINPILLAVAGGAVGYGVARGAIFGGNKLAAMPAAPKFAQNFNVGAGAATAAGIIMVIFSKNLAVQSAGVGMITTCIPEFISDIQNAMNDGETTQKIARIAAATPGVNFETEEDDEPQPGSPIMQAKRPMEVDLMRALAIAEDLED
jgi:hypothetical protein